MKKYVFYLLSSVIIFTGGATFVSCDDDDEPTPPTETPVGKKTFDILVMDEQGNAVAANLSIKKGGQDLSPVSAPGGSYSLDVSKESSGTAFEFKATYDGYVSSKSESEVLTYKSIEDEFSQQILLYLIKRGDPVTIDPTRDTKFELSSTTVPGSKVKVNVPAGATGTTAITLYPTVIPTSASRGTYEVESPNNSVALQIIDLESNFTGNFADGKKVEFTFPLAQSVIDLVVNQGVNLLFTSNSHGTLESYPITVNMAEKTGTVAIPHFSTWYISPDIPMNVEVVLVENEVVRSSGCSLGLSLSYSKPNAPLPDFFSKLFNRTTVPPMVGSIQKTGATDESITAYVDYKRITISAASDPSKTYTVFESPKFHFVTTACTHDGGTGG